MTTTLQLCQGRRVITLGRMEFNLVCQIGIHRGGKCRMALQDDVIVMFEPKEKSESRD